MSKLTRKRFWFSVGISFFVGTLISGLGVYKYLYDAFSDSLALAFIYSDIVYAERDIQLLMLGDEEFRCELSKRVDDNVGRLNGYNIYLNPVADSKGVLADIVESRTDLIDLYKESSVWDHAKECAEFEGVN